MEKEFYNDFIQNLEKELPNEREFVYKLAKLIEKNKLSKDSYLKLINEEIK